MIFFSFQISGERCFVDGFVVLQVCQNHETLISCIYHSTSIKQRADVEFKSLERKTISVDNTLSLQLFLQSTVHVLVSFLNAILLFPYGFY